ncbi:MAG: LpqB family beta-propeller domain-containing protein [Jatrophihabitantaceae bacterium]
MTPPIRPRLPRPWTVLRRPGRRWLVRRRPGRRWLVLGVLVVVATVLSGCAGIPTSSKPQVVQSLQLQPQPPQGITPLAGADPRSIVAGFLDNNASDDAHHSAARAFLTPEAKARWSDSTQTQVFDALQIGNFDSGTINVTGHLIGTIDPSGAYSPSLPGEGDGVRGTSVPLPFTLTKVEGQWRIDSLPSGLLITSAQFSQFYTQEFVYYYDQAETHLVPDPRWTALRDPDLLATWLMTQLLVQPRSSLSTALPSIPNASQVKVSLTPVLTVDVPGASQLDSATRNRMAQQVAVTLDQAAPNSQISITDGGRGVSIPQVGGDRFTAAQFSTAVLPANRVPALYFIAKGGVVDANGKALPGGIGSGQYGLHSVALASYVSTPQLLVAGTSGPPDSARLLVGQTGGQLKPTGVKGPLSRPAWLPNSDEVWVGDGKTIYRLVLGGKAVPVPFTAQTGTVGGQVIALRFSPEGGRVALVIKADDGTSQIWVGDVVRSSDSVRVSGLSAISPLGIAITDVAWNDPFTLFAIGHEISSNEGGVFDVQCDGALWLARGIGNLPQAPDSITVAENVVASVSAGGTVWVQQTGGSWASPTSGSTTYGASGTNPVYLE